MTDSPSIVVAGIDVGKSKLDAHILGVGLDRQFDNTKTGRRALCNWLLKHHVTRTIFESTGRYHRNLHQCLADAGLQTVPVNPMCSRCFAEAIGRLTKNDRVDAACTSPVYLDQNRALLPELDCAEMGWESI